MLALLFVPLSGPLFFCKCEGRVITISQLKTAEECCGINCGKEPVPAPVADCCSEDPAVPCAEEVILAVTAPHLDGVDLPLPPEVAVPGEYLADLALLADCSPPLETSDEHPPPGSKRLHLHLQILLI